MGLEQAFDGRASLRVHVDVVGIRARSVTRTLELP
jgi:hypothetical protein